MRAVAPPAPSGLLAALAPGRWGGATVVAGVVAAATFGFLLGSGTAPLWVASLAAFAVAGVPWALKVRDDLRAYGVGVAMLVAMLLAQGLHTVEHLVQVGQVYLLDWPAGRSLGLITAANAEWIHLAWNLLVLVGVIVLMRHGMRSPWAWALAIWAGLHSAEHAYLFVRYLQVTAEARQLGLGGLPVTQALPGLLGRDGLLAAQSWCGRIPGITDVSRVVVHFVWNAGEVVLLILAGRHYLVRLGSPVLPGGPRRPHPLD